MNFMKVILVSTVGPKQLSGSTIGPKEDPT